MAHPHAFSFPAVSPGISMPRSGSEFFLLNSVNCVNLPHAVGRAVGARR